MTNSEDDQLTSSPSHVSQFVEVLETALKQSVFIGVHGSLLTAVVLFGYIAIGGVLVVVGSSLAPPSFLELEADPVFYLSVAVTSIFVTQATGSLILYKFLTGIDDQQSQFVILMSYIGLGFGGAALRFTLPQSIAFLIELL